MDTRHRNPTALAALLTALALLVAACGGSGFQETADGDEPAEDGATDVADGGGGGDGADAGVELQLMGFSPEVSRPTCSTSTPTACPTWSRPAR
jgi:hypothetical protein